MCTIGAHVAAVHVNSIGNIKPEDVFLGIIGPVFTPILLKAVRRYARLPPMSSLCAPCDTMCPMEQAPYHDTGNNGSLTTIYNVHLHHVHVDSTGTRDEALRVPGRNRQVRIAKILFSRPKQQPLTPPPPHRNIVATSTLLPFAWGCSMAFILHCTFRRRTLYILSSFMTVFAGREMTMSSGSKIIVATFLMQSIASMMTIVASNADALEWMSIVTGANGWD